MNIQQLRHFVAVADRGSLLRAAEDLNISQSGLSRSIAALEDALGLPLFERQPRGVSLTEPGRKFLRRARVMLHEYGRARQELKEQKELRAGKVTVGLNNFLAYFLVNSVVYEILSRPGQIQVQLVFDNYHALRERTLAAEFDLAVSIYEPGRTHPELMYEDLLSFDTLVYANRDHPLAQAEAVTAEDLAQCRWALIEGRAVQGVFEDYFRTHRVREPLVALQSASIPMLTRAVAQLELVTLLPRQLVGAGLPGSERLQALRTATPFGKARIGLIHRPHSVQTPVAQEFATLLKKHAKLLEQERTLA